MSAISREYFTVNSIIYFYSSVLRAGPPVGGNTQIFFTDGTDITVTNAEAKDIFQS